jgi:hypothetical protein
MRSTNSAGSRSSDMLAGLYISRQGGRTARGGELAAFVTPYVLLSSFCCSCSESRLGAVHRWNVARAHVGGNPELGFWNRGEVLTRCQGWRSDLKRERAWAGVRSSNDKSDTWLWACQVRCKSSSKMTVCCALVFWCFFFSCVLSFCLLSS